MVFALSPVRNEGTLMVICTDGSEVLPGGPTGTPDRDSMDFPSFPFVLCSLYLDVPIRSLKGRLI